MNKQANTHTQYDIAHMYLVWFGFFQKKNITHRITSLLLLRKIIIDMVKLILIILNYII